jgi:hypothetical protein
MPKVQISDFTNKNNIKKYLKKCLACVDFCACSLIQFIQHKTNSCSGYLSMKSSSITLDIFLTKESPALLAQARKLLKSQEKAISHNIYYQTIADFAVCAHREDILGTLHFERRVCGG